MSEPFDFRDLLGGAGGKVSPDPMLADGMKDNGEVDGLHAHLMTKRAGMGFLVNSLAEHLCANANVNGLCAQGLAALVIARLGQKALTDLPEGHAQKQRDHLIAEVQAMLDAMRRGDA